jgi:outer membrane autotransporter protein
VVTLGYKVNPNIRIGGFLDQSINNNNPTGINVSNKNPMMGVFAYWNQNPDGLGYQVKIANAFQDKDLSTTRDVIGTSEAGTGKTSLNTRSYVSELSYAFMYKENTLVRPYFALRYTTIEQDAYTETGVEAPLTYSGLNDRTTSALMGVKFKHALTPKANLIGSLGVEQDLHHKTDRLTATNADLSTLTSENFSGNIHRTRPVASLGATYDIAKTQRLSGEVLVQQLPFQSTAGATAYFNYMIGF